nr:histidine kinase [Methylobacterium sp. GC_Met_2]
MRISFEASVQEEEPQALARDLYDAVGQGLAALGARAAAIELAAPPVREDLRGGAQGIESLADVRRALAPVGQATTPACPHVGPVVAGRMKLTAGQRALNDARREAPSRIQGRGSVFRLAWTRADKLRATTSTPDPLLPTDVLRSPNCAGSRSSSTHALLSRCYR